MEKNFAIIYAYACNQEGGYEEIDDLLAVRAVDTHLDSETAIDSGVLDGVLSEIDGVKYVTFEIYNVAYSSVIKGGIEQLLDRLTQELVNMIEDGEIEYVSDYKLLAEVGVGRITKTT